MTGRCCLLGEAAATGVDVPEVTLTLADELGFSHSDLGIR